MTYRLRPRFQSTNSIFTNKDCHLSNDPPEDGSVQELSLCNIQQYRCRPPSDNVEEVIVSYQYELLILQDAIDHNLAREYLEEAMLEQFASHAGTIECDGTNRGIYANVWGVSREPSDTVDSRFSNCLTPPVEGTVCYSMLGQSTLLLSRGNHSVDDDDHELITATIDFIRSEMEKNLYVRSGSIEKVVFVNRTVSVGEVQDVDISAKPRQSGLTESAKAGTAIGVAFVLLLLMTLFVVVTKKNRKQARVLEGPDDDEFSLGDGSLAMKDSLALKPRRLTNAETPPRKKASSENVMSTPETPQSDISYGESPKEKIAHSRESPTSIMTNADAERHNASVIAFALSKSKSATEASVPDYYTMPYPSGTRAPETLKISPIASKNEVLDSVYAEDYDTASDLDQGCCFFQGPFMGD